MVRERCKACGMPKPPLAVEQEDDFCSTDCARRYYEKVREERGSRDRDLHQRVARAAQAAGVPDES